MLWVKASDERLPNTFVVLGALLPRTELWIPSASFLSFGESKEASSCQISVTRASIRKGVG